MLLPGVKPSDILTNKEAGIRNLGAFDINSIDIQGEKLKDVIARPFKLPTTSITANLPHPVISILRRLIRFYPKVNNDKCIRCGACIKACPKKIIKLTDNGILINNRGCISCFCCQETCPNAAISVNKTVLARLLGL